LVTRTPTKWLWPLALSLALFGGRADTFQLSSEAARVQQDVQVIVDAMYDGDVDTIIRYTHPAVIAMMGGMDATRKRLEHFTVTFKSTGIRLESLTFPKPPEFLEGGGRRFVVVPTLSIVSGNGQRVESLNFQFGVLEPNATEWTYIEGSRVRKEMVQSLFPGFPATYEFPPFYRKKVEN
jgi:hypothetical protein